MANERNRKIQVYQASDGLERVIHTSSDTSLQWAAPHLTLMHYFLYIQLSNPGATQA